MQVREFFHHDTSTLTYVVFEPESLDAIVIDPAMDYEPASSKAGFAFAKQILFWLQQNRYEVRAVLETHAHADHISSARFFKERYPKSVLGIGSKITQVQKTFSEIYDFKNEISTDGSQFDLLLDHRGRYSFGAIEVECLHTPGHTPSCASYLIGDKLFTGDALFLPDFGTGRCDFPGGDARVLFQSIRENIYSLPENTEIYVGHDYQPEGRELRWKTTVKESKERNIHIHHDTTEDEFVRFRRRRDQELTAPRLLLPSIQVNVNGGRFPVLSSDGRFFIKSPIFFEEN